MNTILIEQKKYKRLKTSLIFAVFYLLVIAITLMTVGDISFLTSEATQGNRWLSVLDSITIFKILYVPILVATLTSRVVEMENNGNMWKMLYALGVEKQSLFISKFALLMFKYFIYLLIEYILIIFLTKRAGLTESIPTFRMLYMFICQLFISYMLMSFHYTLALNSSNQIVNIFVAITGSLVGIIGLFLPTWFSAIIPYSWMGKILNLRHILIEEGKFKIAVNPINPLPLFLSLVIGTGILLVSANYFNRKDMMNN